MKRIALSDGTGSWFDPDKAECFEENTYWNGNNHISLATGSQWEHESIYVTASGKFILHQWSNYQGSAETYELISEQEAAVWFSKQSFKEDDIPESLRELSNDLEIS